MTSATSSRMANQTFAFVAIAVAAAGVPRSENRFQFQK